MENRFSEVMNVIGPWARMFATGSRIICDPAPTNTDEDWVVYTPDDRSARLLEAGFTQDGAPEFYTGNDNGGFRSWRRGDLNIVTTTDARFYDLFKTATILAKRFNLTSKADRIALFQVVLYGVRPENLTPPSNGGNNA